MNRARTIASLAALVLSLALLEIIVALLCGCNSLIDSFVRGGPCS